MRGAAVVAMLAGMSCGGGAKPAEAPLAEPPLAEAPVAPVAPRDSGPWWCASFGLDELGDSEIGACAPDEASCTEARAPLVAHRKTPDARVSACTRVEAVACFDLQRQDGTRDVCHPTMATCRAHQDRLPTDERALGPCRIKGSVTTAAEDDVHWWCMTFGDDPMGACDRSREKCEVSRGLIKRRFPNDKLSACTPQATASCTDVSNGREHHLACAPSEPLCRTVVEATRLQQSGARTSACHPVD